jgi:hypothetical protein
MDYNFLITFIILSIVNVVLATIKSLVTINGGKVLASLFSGGYFAFYNVMVIYTVADFPMWQKCAITFVCNVIGVYFVKWGEEKARKDKLWKVEATIPTIHTETVDYNLDLHYIPHSFVKLSEKHTVFYCYCETQDQSKNVKKILDEYDAKYFVSESKTLT